MKKQLQTLLHNPEVKELAVSLAGIAAGLIVQKLIGFALRRSSLGMAGKLVQVAFAAWLATNPQVIDGWIKQIAGSPANSTL